MSERTSPQLPSGEGRNHDIKVSTIQRIGQLIHITKDSLRGTHTGSSLNVSIRQSNTSSKLRMLLIAAVLAMCFSAVDARPRGFKNSMADRLNPGWVFSYKNKSFYENVKEGLKLGAKVVTAPIIWYGGKSPTANLKKFFTSKLTCLCWAGICIGLLFLICHNFGAPSIDFAKDLLNAMSFQGGNPLLSVLFAGGCMFGAVTVGLLANDLQQSWFQRQSTFFWASPDHMSNTEDKKDTLGNDVNKAYKYIVDGFSPLVQRKSETSANKKQAWMAIQFILLGTCVAFAIMALTGNGFVFPGEVDASIMKTLTAVIFFSSALALSIPFLHTCYAVYQGDGKVEQKKAAKDVEQEKAADSFVEDYDLKKELNEKLGAGKSPAAPAGMETQTSNQARRRMASKALPRLLQAINEENCQ